MVPDLVARQRAYFQAEVDSAALYRSLADAAPPIVETPR
jgi:hypothetical protein